MSGRTQHFLGIDICSLLCKFGIIWLDVSCLLTKMGTIAQSVSSLIHVKTVMLTYNVLLQNLISEISSLIYLTAQSML